MLYYLTCHFSEYFEVVYWKLIL